MNQAGFSKFFVRLLLVVLGIVCLFLLIGVMLPRGFDVEATLEVDATPERIFEQVNDLRQWQNWSDFNSKENAGLLELNYGATTIGKDASMTWLDHRGKGKLWITDSVANEKVSYNVDFAGFPRMKSSLEVKANDANKTSVTWRSQGQLPGGPFYGWFGIYFYGALQESYLKNLGKLKNVVEDSGDMTSEQPVPK